MQFKPVCPYFQKVSHYLRTLMGSTIFNFTDQEITVDSSVNNLFAVSVKLVGLRDSTTVLPYYGNQAYAMF